ncbi:MAG: hypothetical protein LUD29_06685 [Clostridia bacterium]|nr:hypothetical protein [Clostridia bacterium]
MDFFDIFDKAVIITVYRDGDTVMSGMGSDGYLKIMSAWKEMTCGARLLSPMGVAVTGDVCDVTDGVWLEFSFGEKMEAEGLSFEALLVNVAESASGFNVIRYDEKKGYDGRCFFVDLGKKDMSVLTETLESL